MKKLFIVLLPVLICFANTPVSAQKTTEKVKTGTKKISESTAKTAADAQEVGANVQATVNNVKSIIRVFEPFLVQIRGVRSNASTQSGQNTSPQSDPSATVNNSPAPATTDNTTPDNNNTTAGSASSNMPATIPSSNYNSDGTANWGCQDHQQYGSNMDAQRGIIMDEVDVATQTGAVDIIFTAAKMGGGAPFYHLVSPNYSKSPLAGHFFIGEKYKSGKQPTKEWTVTNTSQIALTTITGAQFEKVQSNEQLTAVVNQAGGFKETYDSRTKLDGKVFAVRTQIQNRTSYALIYVVEHVGVLGSSCFLKVKLKVNGVDGNSDGLPDRK